MKRLLSSVLAIALLIGTMVSCTTEADLASRNLSVAAEQFEVERRIVFVNGITDNWIMAIEGKCSVEFHANKFEVTCKTPSGEYIKHYLGRADNVFPFVEQLDPKRVSKSRYRVVLRPSVVIPDIDVE